MKQKSDPPCGVKQDIEGNMQGGLFLQHNYKVTLIWF